MPTIDEQFEKWRELTKHTHGNLVFSGTAKEAFLAGAEAGRAEERGSVLMIIAKCAEAITDVGGDTNLTRFGKQICDEIERRIRQRAEQEEKE